MNESTEVVETLDELYEKYIEQEETLRDWIIITYPIPVAVALLYLVFLKVGLQWMKGRPAFKLNNALRLHDLMQVFLNLYILSGTTSSPSSFGIVLENMCQINKEQIPILSGEDFAQLRYDYMYYSWFYLITKMTDLLDTIFMVLMKKNSQITFLHVYHHASMVVFPWITFRYAKSIQAFFPVLVNILVHVIMYSYYFLTTFGPSVQKYLWWKEHLTKLQLVQFVAVILYVSMLYLNGCTVSKNFIYIWVFNVGIFLLLFVQFYINTYITHDQPCSYKKKIDGICPDVSNAKH